MHIRHRRFGAAVHLSPSHREQHDCAVDKTRSGSQGDERIHVRRLVHQAGKTAYKEFFVDQHHDGSQNHLDQTHGDVIVPEECGQREAPHGMPHGKVHEDQKETKRGKKPSSEDRRFPVFQSILFRFQFRSERCVLLFRLSFWRSAVSCVLHRFYNIRSTCGTFHAHAVGQKTDRTGCDSGNCVYCLLHSRLTGSAAHSGYKILIHTYSSISSVSA